jgi:hypothetical protein
MVAPLQVRNPDLMGHLALSKFSFGKVFFLIGGHADII